MNLSRSMKKALLSEEVPFGAVLGTPRSELVLPGHLSGGAVESWRRARGEVEADGLSAYLAWELEGDVLTTASANVRVEGNPAAFIKALVDLYTPALGAPKAARGALTWKVVNERKVPCTLTVKETKGAPVVVIELTGQPPALEAVGEIPAAFIGLVLDEGGSAGTVALEGAVSPFPAQCARSVSLARGKVAAVVVSLPDFDDESVFERVLAMVERALVEKLGKPKRAKKQLSYEEWRSYTWGSEGREITVRGSAYLEPSGQVTHRRIEVSNRAL